MQVVQSLTVGTSQNHQFTYSTRFNRNEQFWLRKGLFSPFLCSGGHRSSGDQPLHFPRALRPPALLHTWRLRVEACHHITCHHITPHMVHIIKHLNQEHPTRIVQIPGWSFFDGFDLGEGGEQSTKDSNYNIDWYNQRGEFPLSNNWNSHDD